MRSYLAILWQEFVLFKRKFRSITLGAMISPVLYLIAFGWGLGGGMTVGGHNYLQFVIPGIVALTTMMVSFSTVGNAVNLSRIYDKTFEEFMVAPVKMSVYAAGKISAGALRGLYSGVLILLIALFFPTGLKLNALFFLILILNCLVFSALGFTAGVLIDSHADMAKFTNFVITPMAFLCGTFFPLEKMPWLIKAFIGLLPLTHTSQGLRNSGGHLGMLGLNVVVLALYFVVLFVVGVRTCTKAEAIG